MRKLTLTFAVAVFGIAMALYSCGGATEEKKADTDEAAQTEEAAPVQEVDEMAVMMARGEEIYKLKCIVCHMANGEGVAGAFPPLANSDYLLSDKVRAVAQTLNGSHEEMIVNGETYNAPMPPQVDTKEDAVAVINYVLNNFGNDGGNVSMEDVEGVEINPREDTKTD